MFRLWYDLIEEYSPRRFTNIGDRLVALSGLARAFGRAFGSAISCDEYVAGLWKPDLIRGLMWHTEGARLVPRDSPQSMRDVHPTFPSWSWASVGFEPIKNHQKSSEHLQALSRVEEVRIELVDQDQPFGAVRNGGVILSGPLKRVPRLYNKAWKSPETSITELERHLSEVVETESPAGVKPSYSNPPGGHFAALQMLGDSDSLDLLILEATGEVCNGIHLYRRVGVLTLRYFDKRDTAPPDLMAYLQKDENFLTARLGPRRNGGRRVKGTNRVMLELRREPWGLESVVIV
jgi:hypothetical protein